MTAAAPLVEVRDLSVSFQGRSGVSEPVRGVNLRILKGERVALVGESGSGTSLTALSLTRLVERYGGRLGDRTSIRFQTLDVMAMSEAELRALRGAHVGMIFQDPLSSLNPMLTVGQQIAEALTTHGLVRGRAEAEKRVTALLDDVGIAEAARRQRAYPHEFSGGMRQRVMIATAIACRPQLIVADEPTTALDATVQRSILRLLDDLVGELGISVLMITHDLDVARGFSDRILVMYGGRVVESGEREAVLDGPQHPYTAALLRSAPSVAEPRRHRLAAIPGFPPDPRHLPEGCSFHPRCERVDPALCGVSAPVLELVGGDRGVACHFPGRPEAVDTGGDDRPVTRARQSDDSVLVSARDVTKIYRFGRMGRHEQSVAVNGVTLEIRRGETVGLVGESGSGKSTLGRCLAWLEQPTSGFVTLLGQDCAQLSPRQLRALRRDVQVVFQDPKSSLDPRWRIGRILMEPLKVHGLWGTPGYDQQALETLMETVGLGADHLNSFPHEFSGGQRQRLAIAKAVALRPKLIVLDEPVSALDVSIRAGVVNLLLRLQDELALSYLFIAHDLGVVRHVSDRVAVMSQGALVELAQVDAFFDGPRHPYSRELLEASQPMMPRDGRGSWPDQATSAVSS